MMLSKNSSLKFIQDLCIKKKKNCEKMFFFLIKDLNCKTFFLFLTVNINYKSLKKL